MSGYLLDADTASSVLREPRGAVAARIAQVGLSRVALSLISTAELWFGAAKRGSARLQAEIVMLVERSIVIPLETPTDIIYADLRADLERRGMPIGGNALWLAAHALALDRTLVTANTREFSRVPGLRIENWMA
ncbi:MAG: PIN domain-containing protein [Terriglobales bacterium]